MLIMMILIIIIVISAFDACIKAIPISNRDLKSVCPTVILNQFVIGISFVSVSQDTR